MEGTTILRDRSRASEEPDERASSWEDGQSLGFPIHFKAVMAHLRQDMRDDWYYDCLQYKDMFEHPDHVKSILLRLLHDWDGCYVGSRSYVRDIPKTGYGERYGLETDFYDRFVYQAICSFLIPYYDTLLSHRVLSYRYDYRRRKEKYLFKNKIERWFTFEGVTLTFKGTGKHLLITDLSNFFENVSRRQVTAALTDKISEIKATGPEKLQIRNAIATLDQLLSQWTFSGDHGLPQNRDASSFLSNVLLAQVDRCMVERGHDYYRYVDDIRIVANTERDARRALQDLIRELRKVGMNINTAKTEILPPEASEEQICKYFPSQDSRTSAINSMWQSRSRRVITRSLSYIVDILNDCIAKGETQSRQFRFAVNRLTTMVDSGFVLDEYFIDQLIGILCGSLSEHAASTDQYCRLLAIVDRAGSCLPGLASFLVNEKSAIHDWQNYNIWLLLAVRRYHTDELVELAERKLTESMTTGEAAAIMIWLRCVNLISSIERVVASHSEAWPTQNVRYLLISASALGEGGSRPLYGKIPTKLKGTTTRTSWYNNDDGLPFVQREPFDMLDLIDEVSAYD